MGAIDVLVGDIWGKDPPSLLPPMNFFIILNNWLGAFQLLISDVFHALTLILTKYNDIYIF